MNAIAQSLVPVFILILLGYGVRKRGFIDDAFWAPAEKITYYVFFPALLIVSGARADLNGANVGPMVLALFSATLATALLALAMKSRLGLSDSAFTSFFQGSFRPNTYVGVAVAYLLWGDDGLGLIALCILAVVPLANLLAVMVMVRYGEAHEGARTPSRAALEVARNPLVLGCLVGFGLNASGLVLPPLVEPLFDILGRAALPIALLAVGAGLDFAPLKKTGKGMAIMLKATVLKLVVLPSLAWVMAAALGLSGPSFEAVVLYASLSGSATSYVMAREMGGDAPLMAGIITTTTVAAMASMPFWMWLAA